MLPVVAVDGGYSLLWCACFSLQWLLYGVQAVGARALVVAAHGLNSCGSQALELGSVVVGHRLSCSMAHAVFLDQMDSSSLDHQGNPNFFFFLTV